MVSAQQKQKVLVFTTAYAPFIGGAEVAIQEVARRLKNHFDFVIFTSRMRKNLPKKEVRSEGLVVRVGFGTPLDKFWLLVFGWVVVLRELSLVKGNALFWVMDFSFGAAVAGFLKIFYPKIPLVFTIQYGEGEKRISKGRFGLMKLAFGLILVQADYVTAISSYLLNLCRQYGYIGEEAIIHNGADLQKFQIPNPKSETISKSQIQNPKTIVTLSRLVPKNGVDILIEAIAELKRKLPTSNLQLHIVGDGPELENLKISSEKLKVADSIKFVGEVPHDQIPKYLSGADVFVRPSRSEGMGNAFIEALAAGVPIIGTAVGGITDIIEDGKTGIFAKVDDPKDLADKIKILLNNKALAARIVENGRKMIAERFDWDKIADLYNNIFTHELEIKKRILIATGIFPPEVGGPATYSKILLDDLPRQGLGVRISTYGTSKTLPWFIRHALFGMRTFFMARSCDVLYAQDAVNSGAVSVISAFIWRKRFFVKIVGDYAWEQGTQRFGVQEMLDDFLKKKYGWKIEILRKIQKFVADRSEKIIVPSEYLKKIVLRWGVNPNQVIVIYNAFVPDRSRTSISKELARVELGLDGKVLVSAGRLVPWKGFDALIEVVMDLLISFPDIKLVIIGDGPKRETLKSQIANNKLQNNVILTDALPREKLLKYLIAADLFVLNTSYEGMSHQILEAMSLGVPIITTDAGGNPELICDGGSAEQNGFLVKFNDKKALADKISKLLLDSNLAKKFSENAKKKAQEFSLERMIGETIKILNL